MTLDPDFLYPDYDDGSLGWFCMRTLAIVEKYQAKWFQWYNYKWETKLKCKLEVLQPAQLIEGFPLTANSRALHCFGIGVQKQPDSYDEQTFSLGLVYSTGKTQLEGQAANQYGDHRVSGFYLQAFNQLFYKLSRQEFTTKEFTEGWPTTNPFYNTLGEVETTTPTEAPNVVIKTTQFNPDSKISAQLNSLGLQGYLQLELLVNSDSIKRPA